MASCPDLTFPLNTTTSGPVCRRCHSECLFGCKGDLDTDCLAGPPGVKGRRRCVHYELEEGGRCLEECDGDFEVASQFTCKSIETKFVGISSIDERVSERYKCQQTDSFLLFTLTKEYFSSLVIGRPKFTAKLLKKYCLLTNKKIYECLSFKSSTSLCCQFEQHWIITMFEKNWDPKFGFLGREYNVGHTKNLGQDFKTIRIICLSVESLSTISYFNGLFCV